MQVPMSNLSSVATLLIDLETKKEVEVVHKIEFFLMIR